MPYLYILRLSDDTHYCGITKEIVKRVQQHQTGKSKSTRNRLPVVLKFLRTYESMKEARKEEMRIKSQGPGRWYYKNRCMKENIIK